MLVTEPQVSSLLVSATALRDTFNLVILIRYFPTFKLFQFLFY